MRHPTQFGMQTMRQAQDFLEANEMTAALGPVTKHVELLGACVKRLEQHAVDQDEHTQGYRASSSIAQAKGRTLRFELMRPIARVSLSLFPGEAELGQALAMPNAKGYEKLLAAGLAMAGRASEHKERFIEAGFAEDFVDRLRKGAEDLRAARDAKSVHFGKRSAATAGMIAELSLGKGLMRVLDDMVSPVLRDSPDRLAQWRTLSRFVRLSRAEQVASTPPVSGTPNTPPVAVPVVAPPAITTVSPVGALATEDEGSVDRAV